MDFQTKPHPPEPYTSVHHSYEGDISDEAALVFLGIGILVMLIMYIKHKKLL